MTWRVNDATNEITAPDGRTGTFADADPVYQEYVAFLVSGGAAEHYSEAPAVQTVFSRLEFLEKFADDELRGILAPETPNADVLVWLEKFRAAGEVDTTDPRTIGGVNALESAGLLAPGRAAQILGI